jgi:low temperature requirement protein LtrA
MTRELRRGPAVTEESHRATSFEIFFDLVFVFAITRVISFMTHSLTFLTLAQGLILLLLLWWSWSAYAWLGNQTRVDQGLIQVGMLVVMAALFVAGLVMPDAWGGRKSLDAPPIVAITFAVVRVVYISSYLYAAGDDRRLRIQLLLETIPQSMALVAIIIGAVLGGTALTVLWAGAFVIDFGSGRISSTLIGGFHLRSPAHFAERHGLVLIIALGESLVSVGVGAGPSITSGIVLVAAGIGFVIAVGLYWLYFANVQEITSRALGEASEVRRAQIGRDAYTFAHFPMIAGILYMAVGIEEVVAHVARGGSTVGGAPLDWPALIALFGGAALYLVGRMTFLLFATKSSSQAQLVVAVASLLVIPAARHLPALAALGLVGALLICLVGYEQLRVLPEG